MNKLISILCLLFTFSANIICGQTPDLEMARQLLKQGKCDKAIEFINKDSSNYPEPEYILERNALKDSVRRCRNSPSQKPSKQDVSSNIEQCDSLLKIADENFINKKYAEAKREYSQILKINPNDPNMKKKIAECDKNIKRIHLFEQIELLNPSLFAKLRRLENRQEHYTQARGGNVEPLIDIRKSINDDYLKLINTYGKTVLKDDVEKIREIINENNQIIEKLKQIKKQ